MKRVLYVGVDVGGTNIRATTLTAGGDYGSVTRAILNGAEGAAGVIRQMTHLVDDVLDAASGELGGIGIAVAGPVDIETGVVSNPWTLPSLAGADVRGPFITRFGVPVIVENDADAAGLGEFFHGSGRDVDSLAMVTLGTGLGVSFVSAGTLLRGAGNYHPEAGHHSIAESGPTCYCGLVGCWEALASGPALERAARAAIRDGRWAPSTDIASAEDVTAAADAQDPVAHQLLDEFGFYVGRGLRTIEAFYAPATIVIGGGLGSRSDLLAPGIERGRLPSSSLSPRARVVGASLGDSAGAIGAACAISLRLEHGSLESKP